MSESPRIIRKRRRPAHSCVECRRRKVRCDRKKPCGQCVFHHVHSCTYAGGDSLSEPRNIIPESGQDSKRTHDSALIPESLNTSQHERPVTSTQIHGTMSKTRVFGHGHWMNTLPLAPELSILGPTEDYKSLYTQPCTDGDQAVISQYMIECKQLGREIKKKRPFRQFLPVHIHRSFPSGVIIDDLIALYFSTFESCFRILHFSSFKREYDNYTKQPEVAKGSFVVILMLVLSIAGTLHHDSQVRKDISSKVQSWISISQTWLSGPLEKDRLTLKGIQMHCLLLISRQVNRVGADLVWISAGSLVRMAMQMGLHQDPNLLRGMDVQQREIRRRLWYTILEINAQSALDSGMTPLIAEVDYTTQPPSNMSDEDLDNAADLQEGEIQYPENPLKSFQSVLAQSIGLRLNAAVIINSLDKEPSYDEVLSIGEKLSLACTEAADVLNPVAIAENQGSTSHFAHSFCSHLLRRFLLCLHFNYAIRAKATPIYTFSKQVCLEVALELVSLLSDELYCKLLVKGGGMFRDMITRGAVMIYLELISGLESGISPFSKTRNRNRQIPLLEDANRVLHYAKNRMYQGETNVKGYVFLSMATARVQALYEGVSSQEATTKAALDSLKLCHEILSQTALEDTIIDIPTDSQPHLSSQTASPDGASEGGFDFLDDPNLNLDSSDWDFFDSMTDENWLNFENK